MAVTRFANIYGGGDLNFSRLVPEAVCAALDGRAPVLRSDGSPVRDLLYVEDAASAYLAIADRLDDDAVRGEAFNAGGERPYSVLEIVETITRSGRHRRRTRDPRHRNPAGEIDRQYVDAAKLRDRCGWEPRGEPRGGPAAHARLVRRASGDQAGRLNDRGPTRPEGGRPAAVGFRSVSP